MEILRQEVLGLPRSSRDILPSQQYHHRKHRFLTLHPATASCFIQRVPRHKPGLLTQPDSR